MDDDKEKHMAKRLMLVLLMLAVGIGGLWREGEARDATESANIALVRELYDSLMARGDVATGRRILAENFRDHDIPGLGTGGREELIQAVLGVRQAFPDIRPQLFELIAEGDMVAVRVEAAGTHTGVPFMGVPPAGRAIRWKEVHLFRLRDGRIVEHRGVFDLLSIMQQLGALPN
jgi:predicted ester cyclase